MAAARWGVAPKATALVRLREGRVGKRSGGGSAGYEAGRSDHEEI